MSPRGEDGLSYGRLLQAVVEKKQSLKAKTDCPLCAREIQFENI